MTDQSVIDITMSRSGPLPAETARATNGSRAQRSAARREAILAAALDEVSAQGFAAARLDDVARRAGVAKGTIYLACVAEEELSTELLAWVLAPFLDPLEAALAADIPARTMADQIVELFVTEVSGTRRKDIIRLIVTEGPRFPTLAEFYYR